MKSSLSPHRLFVITTTSSTTSKDKYVIMTTISKCAVHGNILKRFIWQFSHIRHRYVTHLNIATSHLANATDKYIRHHTVLPLPCVSTQLSTCIISHVRFNVQPGIILCMCPANDRRRYSVTPSLIGWAYTQNDSCITGHAGFKIDMARDIWQDTWRCDGTRHCTLYA